MSRYEREQREALEAQLKGISGPSRPSFGSSDGQQGAEAAAKAARDEASRVKREAEAEAQRILEEAKRQASEQAPAISTAVDAKVPAPEAQGEYSSCSLRLLILPPHCLSSSIPYIRLLCHPPQWAAPV